MRKMTSKLLLVAMLIVNVAVVSAQEVADTAQQSKGFHQVFKERFIEVDLCIWRQYYCA